MAIGLISHHPFMLTTCSVSTYTWCCRIDNTWCTLLHWRRSIAIHTCRGWQGWSHWHSRQWWWWWWCEKSLLGAYGSTSRIRWCIHHWQHVWYCIRRHQSFTRLANTLQSTIAIEACGSLSVWKFSRYLSPCQALGNTFTNNCILIFGKSVTWFSIAIAATVVVHIGKVWRMWMARILVVPLGW